MVPRIGRQGKSFKGAALYYLHDKRAATSERVEHAETRNLPTDDPELGWRVMAATARDADQLKLQAGVDRRGRKLTKPVFHLSTSWHPSERPERAHMLATMDSALAALGLQNHQAVYVIHNDEPHPHIHAFVNLVNPDNGRSNSVRYSKKKLSLWAEAYEREHGIHCDKRIENNAKRAHAKAQSRRPRKAQERARSAAELKAEITRRYHAADGGKAFQASLKELGFTLAQGKRVVLVAKDGTVIALNRQLDGIRAAAVRDKLKGLVLPKADAPPRRQESDDRTARSQDTEDTRKRARRRREPRDTDARRPPPFSREHAREDLHATREHHAQREHERDGDAGINHVKETVHTGLKNRLQDAHHDQWGSFFMESDHQRHRLGRLLDEQYGTHERALRAAIAAREQRLARARGAKRWYAEHVAHEMRTLEQDRLTLASIEQRQSEARGALERSIEEKRAALNERQAQERENVPRDFSPRELDPLARSIEEQQAEAQAAYLGAAAPADSPSGHGTAPQAESAYGKDTEREAFMQRMNGDFGPSHDRGGH